MLVLCDKLCNSNIVVNPEYYTNYYFSFLRTERQQDPSYLDYHIIIRVTSIFKTPAILHRMRNFLEVSSFVLQVSSSL